MPVRPSLLGLLSVVLSGCALFADPFDVEREAAPIFRRSTLVPAPAVTSPPQLRVVAWNIKFGGARTPFWFDCWGDTMAIPKGEVLKNISNIQKLLDEVSPDILITEEVDIASRRTAYVDEVRELLERGPLNYAAWFESWSSGYVPSEGLGPVRMGNAIHSRYPIRKAERIRLPDRSDLDPLTQTFYLHRAVGRAEIEIAQGQLIAVYVLHAEAYDTDGTKQKHLIRLAELLAAETLPFLVGGDFNELPPTAAKVVGFPDERESAICSEDFKQPPYTPKAMQPFYDLYRPHVDLARYGTTEAEQARYYTHSVLGPDDVNDAGIHGDWNRTLDYLFIRKKDAWVPGSTDVLQRQGQRVGGDQGLGPVLVSDVLRLSDHAPLFGIWEVTP
jgi:endonuclease/exonuclease/phosphatase family metal-dependent hydrolase